MALSTLKSSPATSASKVHYARFLASDRIARPCEVRNLREDGASLSGCEIMAEDTPIVLYIHGVGRREALVVAAYAVGMDVRFLPSALSRRTGAAEVPAEQAAERRRHERVSPSSPHRSILLPDGQTQDCEIIDVSPGGVLVSLNCLLPIGAIVQIAGLAGRVSDRREDGTLIRFEDELDTAELAKLIG